jgi:HEAT repeat protein
MAGAIEATKTAFPRVVARLPELRSPRSLACKPEVAYIGVCACYRGLNPIAVTQRDVEELGEIARSIQSLFSRPEHQGPVVDRPSSSGAKNPEYEVGITPGSGFSSNAVLDDSESEVGIAPELGDRSEADVEAHLPELLSLDTTTEGDFTRGAEFEAPDEEVAEAVAETRPEFEAREEEVGAAGAETDAEFEAAEAEPAVSDTESDVRDTAVAAPPPDIAEPEPEPDIAEPEPSTGGVGEDAISADAEVPLSDDSTSADAEVPLSEMEQTLSDATSRYLRASMDEREEARRALRSAVETARSARALDTIASNLDILLLQASGDADVEKLAGDLMDAAVSARMAVALGRIRDEEKREALVQAYTGLGAPFAKAIADVLAETEERLARKTYVAALVAFGTVGAQAVDEMLKDSRWFVVRSAVAVLGGVGAPRAVEALVETLANEHPGVRRETVLSLVKIGGENAGSLVASMLGDSVSEVRSAAARAVGALKVEKSYKALLEILKKGDDEAVMEEVLRALGALGDPSAVPAIEKRVAGSMFSRPPKGVRIAGLGALAAIGTPHAVDVVEKAQRDKDPDISSAAVRFLSGT